MSRDDWLVIFRAVLIALLVTLAAPAFAETDCHFIRAKVAEHGRAKAVAWARSQGYSWSEIWRIRKQCAL